MSNIIMVNGMCESGKDTFVNFCKECNVNTASISVIDYIKDLANREFYCDGEKTQRTRLFYSDLLDLLEEWDDIPNKKVDEFINQNDDKIIFVFSRSPETIKRYVDKYGAKTLIVHRDISGEKVTYSNHADNPANILNYTYDYQIYNYQDLDFLKKQAEIFMKCILTDGNNLDFISEVFRVIDFKLIS